MGTLWGVVLALHLLGMALWVGGTACMLVAIRPALAVLDGAQRIQVHVLALKRFFLLVWHAMVVTIAAGYAMVFGLYGGFAHLDWSVNTMMTLGLIMAAIVLFTFFGPYKRLRRSIRPSAEVLTTIRRLLGASLAVGVVIVFVAALGQY